MKAYPIAWRHVVRYSQGGILPDFGLQRKGHILSVVLMPGSKDELTSHRSIAFLTPEGPDSRP